MIPSEIAALADALAFLDGRDERTDNDVNDAYGLDHVLRANGFAVQAVQK